jgi:hypothetical protein
MWRKNTALFLFLTLMSVLLAPNCATLTRSKMQRIPVTSSPAGATVIVNGIQQGVTPLEIRLARKGKGQVIRIESPGYNPVEISVERKFSTAMLLGDVALGAALGFGVVVLVGAYSSSGNDVNFWDGWDETARISIPAGMVAMPLIDWAFGKTYNLDPKELTVTLTKAVGTPRVDTMFIDAEDFQNIKWIRVHRDQAPAGPASPGL